MEMEGATSADTSYGMTELPDECEVKEGGGVNCAKDVCSYLTPTCVKRRVLSKARWPRNETPPAVESAHLKGR